MYILLLAAFALSGAYFGGYSVAILPTFLQLVRLRRLWPGPIIEDPDPYVRRSRQHRRATQKLFPYFLQYGFGALAAFLLSVIMVLNGFFEWLVPKEGQEWLYYGLTYVVIMVGGRLSLTRAMHGRARIQALFQA